MAGAGAALDLSSAAFLGGRGMIGDVRGFGVLASEK